eukprot:CAMPEP_0115460964 /NCGR_PEP_ID=MMETSP0271-20121206/47061_1 /TAXON_ID=71861 /ORGANISM="Scrippsiella trochoidea, Strain CCMP3099" /LENGTH=45 /DNA_ID= /DNA_START= /DNA_END= /DNA_ORIENTATION=
MYEFMCGISLADSSEDSSESNSETSSSTLRVKSTSSTARASIEII